jgi:3-oxoacyl-[acyl-carrier-protein] synthase-1
MSEQALLIAGLGMISCLGSGAEANAAAMRCCYDGFLQTDFINPQRPGEPLIVAPIMFIGQEGLTRHAELARQVARQALFNKPDIPSELPLFLCLASQERPGMHAEEGYANELVRAIAQNEEIRAFHADSQIIARDRAGFVEALLRARSVLYESSASPPYALVVALDSYLNNTVIHHFGGALGDSLRLLTDDNPNGFIPGEAATALLLRRPLEPNETGIAVTGLGFGREATSVADDEPIRADGLLKALRQACNEAGIDAQETHFRIAALNGEEYFFSEASRAQTQLLTKRVEAHPIWSPCSHIGEVGAAIGGAMTVMGAYALDKNYAPGRRALCHISNDSSERAAFILERGNRTQMDGKQEAIT